MPHFSGVNARDIAVAGEIAYSKIPKFIADCRTEGWKRVAVSEMRLLASFNERGTWVHPELEEAK